MLEVADLGAQRQAVRRCLRNQWVFAVIPSALRSSSQAFGADSVLVDGHGQEGSTG